MIPSFLPMWFRMIVMICVVLPFKLFEWVTYLPYKALKKMGLGEKYKKKHYILTENVHQFILQPKNYLKKHKNIHAQIVKESNELKD